MTEQIKKLIAEGENQHIEFKKAKNDFPKDAFETICAFLNTDGGILILGVEDDGTVKGVNADSVNNIKTKFVTSINNQQIFSPTIYLDINEIKIDNKTILYVRVPNGSDVYRYKGKIFKRNFASDVDITNVKDEVTRLYLKTDNTYSENQIIPYFPINELREDLINRVKKIVKNNNPQMDWSDLTIQEFLEKNKLYKKDHSKNNEGITLAGVLLFGTEDQIEEYVPSFKFEVAKCVDNPERYDDRITLQTNLIDCLDAASKFIEKYLPSPFYLEGIQRIDLRSNIFREIIANMLVHKEYSSAEPTKLIIYKDKIVAQNSNIPRIHGLITLENTYNFSKNPRIAKIFRAMGFVEDFGTGIPKLFKYCKEYTGYEPIIEDEKTFRITLRHEFFKSKIKQIQGEQIKLFDTANVSDKVNNNKDQVRDQVRDQAGIIDFCKIPKSLKEIMQHFGYTNKTKFRNKFLNPLIENGIINLTFPESPHSPKQKYYTVTKEASDD